MKPSRSVVWMSRAYAWLVRTYPAGFRQRYGPDMAQVFRDKCLEVERTRGIPGLIKLSLHTAIDWLRTAVHEHMAAVGDRDPVFSTVQRSPDGVPAFQTIGDDKPRSSALVNGMIVTLVLFLAFPLGITRGGGRHIDVPTITMPGANSHGTGSGETSSGIARALPKVAGEKLISWESGFIAVRAAIGSAIQFLRPASLSGSVYVGAGHSTIDQLISQFDRSDVVALGEWHGVREDQDLRIHLIRHPEFPKKARNIVVECANAFHQNLLDRYIAGEDVPRKSLQKVWRGTTQTYVGGGDSPMCEEFLLEVRSVNSRLPSASRLRVLAADPPIDWSRIQTRTEFLSILRSRDIFAAGVISREVLGKGEKALVIFGAGHLWRNSQLNKEPNIADLLDRGHPGRLYTVVRLSGIFADTAKLESLIHTSARPVLLHTKGTAVGALKANQFIGRDLPKGFFPEGLGMAEVVDACIYTGQRPATMVRVAVMDAEYEAEKQRRRQFMPR